MVTAGPFPGLVSHLREPQLIVPLEATSEERTPVLAHSAGHVRLWATIRPANVASVRTILGNGYLLVRSEPDAKGPLDYYVHEVATLP